MRAVIVHKCDRCGTPIAKRQNGVLVLVERAPVSIDVFWLYTQCPGCQKPIRLRLVLPDEDAAQSHARLRVIA